MCDCSGALEMTDNNLTYNKTIDDREEVRSEKNGEFVALKPFVLRPRRRARSCRTCHSRKQQKTDLFRVTRRNVTTGALGTTRPSITTDLLTNE